MSKQRAASICRHFIAATGFLLAACTASSAEEPELLGYWKLAGDCRDHSGNGHEAVNHGVSLETSAFDGKQAYVEVPDAGAFHLGEGDFTISAEVFTEKNVTDVLGDILTKYDPATRTGLNFTLCASNPGYNCGQMSAIFFSALITMPAALGSHAADPAGIGRITATR